MPPLRSTIDAAPTTCPPAAVATWIVSRVEPPVVTHVLDDEHAIGLGEHEPAAQHERAVLPFGEDARARPSARPTSWPMTTPPSAGDSTTVGRRSADALGERAAERFGVLRVLQHERALQIAGAVQAGGQAEVAVEQRAGAPEQIEQVVDWRHDRKSCECSGSGSIQFESLNRIAPAGTSTSQTVFLTFSMEQ